MNRLNMAGKSLVDLLFDRVNARPHHQAIVQDNACVDYGELWRRVVDLSEILAEQGIKTGERVILLMDNSIHYAVTYYALLRLTAVVVPLNTGLKRLQLMQIISHAQAKLLVHDGKVADELTALPIATLDVSEKMPLNSGMGVSQVRNPYQVLTESKEGESLELCTIIYTSGTTGRPKGVMLSANNLLTNTLAIIEYLELTGSDRTMCVLPFYYAYGNSVLHTHLAVGATLVLENNFIYPQRVLQRMAEEQVTGFAGVPSTFRLLLLRCDLTKFPLRHLRYVTQAGGALSPADIRRVVNYWPTARFFVMYGQTEATARLTYLPPERLDDKIGSVGIPVAGVEIKIMDANGREKPRGKTGEICAVGPNIMQGYWRDAAASEAKFFGKWLRTGDLGFQDDEGFTTIIGRGTEMIKTGDHRVAPEEIEQIIATMDTVEEVAVVGIPDELLGQVIQAFVVRSADSALDERAVLRHCKQQCAQYKMPRTIVFLPALPKTASGKIQRYRLVDNFSDSPVEDRGALCDDFSATHWKGTLS
jgi:long-chain acyl-CoA synthetase